MEKRLRNFNKIIDYYETRLAYWEILLAWRENFLVLCSDILLLEPTKKNNYIWALIDLSGYDEVSIKGAEQQLIAIEKGYIL